MTGNTVYVVTVQHKHGENVYVCSSQEKAELALDKYVQEWWGYEMDGVKPKDREQRIAAYFSHVANEDYTSETLTIDEDEGKETDRIGPCIVCKKQTPIHCECGDLICADCQSAHDLDHEEGDS